MSSPCDWSDSLIESVAAVESDLEMEDLDYVLTAVQVCSRLLFAASRRLDQLGYEFATDVRREGL